MARKPAYFVSPEFRACLEAVPDAMVMVDADGVIGFVNSQAEQLFGYTQKELLGAPVETLLPERFRTLHVAHRKGFFSKPRRRSMGEGLELYARSKGGKEFPIDVSLSPLRSDGELLAVAAIRDVSAQVRTGDALRAAKEEAERATVSKSRFLVAASHDLRQPLQSLGMYLAVLQRKLNDPQERDIASSMSQSLYAMGGLLDALLDISKLDAGAIEPEVTTFPVQLLLDNVIADNAPHATQKGLSLRVMPSSYLVRSDAGLLERIVENFVTNAIRYTDTGRMLVGCRRRRNQVRIEVWDTGVGIPEDALKTIFEEYFQLDNPARDRSKGLGLGLAIVDSIARLLGHQIDVTSTLNKGSIFAVEVPLAGRMKPQATQEQLVENRSEQGISVLFVDDDPAIISAMRLLMEVTGYRITTAMSGSEALAVLTSVAEPDVIVADFRLPEGETGSDVVQRLRDAIGAEIPAIILTGDTSAQHIRAANLPHCSILHKPADGDKLIALIDRIAGL